MDNNIFVKPLIFNVFVLFIVVVLLSFIQLEQSISALVGGIALLLPNAGLMWLSWMHDKNQRVIKGVALNYVIAVLVKYIFVIALMVISVIYFKLPLLPIILMYLALLVIQTVLFSLYKPVTK